MSGRYLDPDCRKHGIPTWPWGMAPQHLRTRRQLARDGKRPGAEPEGQILRGRRGRNPLRADLFDAETAVPKRTPSQAQREALRLASWTRSALACERRGIDATDIRELITQARADITARRAAQHQQQDPPQRDHGRGRERSR